MKLFLYAVITITTSWLSNCKKEAAKPAGKESKPVGFTENKTVTVNDCSSFTRNGINYSICLDSVVNESRCPAGAQCIWMGYARAKLIFTAGSSTHHFSLYTLIQNGTGSFPNDTSINGIKVQLSDVSPYPTVSAPVNYSDYKATVIITEQ